MAPKSKKSVKNPFYYFMLEIKDREEAKGRRLPLSAVTAIADPLWIRMSPAEKEPYIRKANQAKGEIKSDTRQKFTSLGVSYADIDAETREKEEAFNIMLQTIRNTVRPLDRRTTLLTHRFYLCHTNFFFKCESGFYSIAEIALSEFNLKDGLLNRLHFFVDPGRMPTGLRYETKEWGEKTHRIDYESKMGEKDYYKIYSKIYEFLTRNNGGVLPPVYTMPENLNWNFCLPAVVCALNTLAQTSAKSSQFRVFPLSHLFFEIRNKCAEVEAATNIAALLPSVAIAENEIGKDVFSHSRDLGCQYHEDIDLSVHCSLSIVTRWVYTICDHCCKHVGVSLELGKHCPKDADLNWDYKYSRSINKFVAENIDKKEKVKDQNSFMPTIIDHGMLKEMREKQYLEEKETLKRAEELRPPRSMNSGIKIHRGNRIEEPEEHLAAGVNKLELNDNNMRNNKRDENFMERAVRNGIAAGACRGGAIPRTLGRGRPLEELQPAMPISGRGRLLSK